MWQPPRPLAQGEASPVRFSATGCYTATAWRDPPESPMRVPPRTPATRRTAAATRFESPLRDSPAPPSTSGTGCRLGTRCGSPCRSSIPVNFSATGCHTRRLGATRLNRHSGFPRARLPHGYTRPQRDRVETDLRQNCNSGRLPYAGVWQAGLVPTHLLGGKVGSASAPGGRARGVTWGEGGQAPKPGGRGAMASGGRHYF